MGYLMDKLLGKKQVKRVVEARAPATSDEIAALRKIQNAGGKVEDIQYIAPDGKVKKFKTVDELDNYIASLDALDLDSIGDENTKLDTVYDDGKPRNKDKCPNCGHKFDEVPGRGRKCPKCGVPFLVRKGNRLFNSDLLNPNDAAAADCFNNFMFSGVTVSWAHENMKKLEQKWHQRVSSEDLMHSIATGYPLQLKDDPAKLLDTSYILYYQYAMFQDTMGKDPRPWLEASTRSNIEYCKYMLAQEGSGQDYLYVSSNSCCEVCRERDGKRVKISVAEEKMPLPFKDCQNRLTSKSKHSFCRANYTWFNPHT